MPIYRLRDKVPDNLIFLLQIYISLYYYMFFYRVRSKILNFRCFISNMNIIKPDWFILIVINFYRINSRINFDTHINQIYPHFTSKLTANMLKSSPKILIFNIKIPNLHYLRKIYSVKKRFNWCF